MAEDKLELPIGVPVDTNADEAANSVESLREQISAGTAEIKAMAGSLRQLRGNSDEVKSAKKQLTTQINALKNSVSSSTLALVKQGTSYDAAAMRAKKFEEQQKKLADQLKKDELAKSKERATAMGAALSTAGGPVAALSSKFGALKAILGETGGSSGLGLVTLAAAGAAAAVAALVVGIGAGAFALGKFILQSANAARNAGLLREAWSGTAQNAANLGTQIDALANKVPTSKAQLNELAIALMKSKLSGAATVDAFNAVAQASAALGDEAGGKIKEFIERGRLLNRFRIDPREMLEGFGNLDFNDVAASLAKGMHISTDAAKKALFEGRVKLEDGAKAMRDAIEGKFGNLNLRKMMSFEVLTEKLHEKLAGLTDKVNLEPLLKPLAELGKLFDESTVTGQSLKLLVTSFGSGMVDALTKGIPLAKEFFTGLIIGSLHAYIAYLDLRNAAKGIFGDSKLLKEGDDLKLALEGGKVAVELLGAALVVTAGAAALAAAPFIIIGGALYGIKKATEWVTEGFIGLFKQMKSIDWVSVGKAIPDGLIAGLKLGASSVIDAVTELAEDVKKGFKLSLHINSPSKDFENYGEDTGEGYVRGVAKKKPAAAAATEELGARAPAAALPAAGGSSGSRPPVIVQIYASNPGDAARIETAMHESSFLARVIKAIEDANIAAAIPVQG